MSSECDFGDVSGVVTTTSWVERVTSDINCIIFLSEKDKDIITTCGPFSVFGANMRGNCYGTNTLV